MQVIFWGMNGIFSRTVLESLALSDFSIAAVFVDGSVAPLTCSKGSVVRLDPPSTDTENEIMLLTPGDISSQQNTIKAAWQFGMPVYAVHKLISPDVTALVESMQVDVACVACFPRRFPSSLLNLPDIGFLNVHPSRLPDYRGPSPLFWQLRDGVDPVGISIHWMDAQFDTGDIATQGSLTLPDGTDGLSADKRLGTLGGTLLVETLDTIASGTPSRQPQSPGGSYLPSPKTDDFRLESTWSARRAFNFMRGTAEWGVPFSLVGEDGEIVYLRNALSYSPNKKMSVPIHREDAQITIQFSPGVVVAVSA